MNISSLFTALLTIAFIVLKLCGVIEWSWLWILSPMPIHFLVSIPLWLLKNSLEEKAKIKAELLEAERRRSPQSSKFMQKLQEAIDKSERIRKTPKDLFDLPGDN
jgi:hypothetical protein